jgi:cystathionine beta-lyase/cystathionine gamma-synthase
MLASRCPCPPHESGQQERTAHRRTAGFESQQGLLSALFADPEQIRIRQAQCDFPGAMFSLELHGGKQAAFDFLRKLRIAYNAVSLGGVETLVCHPKTTTHSGFTEAQSADAGVTDGLVRVSIGIEDWRDLLADFEQALETI